jgi:hypothetical protein
MWRLIVATSQAKLLSPPPPNGITAHARGGQLAHVSLFLLRTYFITANPPTLNIVQYSIFLTAPLSVRILTYASVTFY